MTVAALGNEAGQLLAPVERCWVCEGTSFTRFHECRFDFTEYRLQDPALHAYTGLTTWLVRCGSCGFAQPAELPTLAGFFDRMYDQRWSPDWVASEYDATYKDVIFRAILRQLDRCASSRPRRLLDIGAHAGRFLALARHSGWEVEGIELNPRTAAYAHQRTGAKVHQINAQTLADTGARFHAITLTDVLEHIPEPVALLRNVVRLLEPGGRLAVKVPCGRSQWIKERLLSRITSHEVSLAGNLVHVNHFTPHSLKLALERAGLNHVTVSTGAPELMPADQPLVRRSISNLVRLSVYTAAQLPGGVETPLALNLQAYATT